MYGEQSVTERLSRPYVSEAVSPLDVYGQVGLAVP